MDRTTIIRGPAQITYDGAVYYSQGDIRLNIGHETFPIVNSAFGTVQMRTQQRTATVSFTPVGNLIPFTGTTDGQNSFTLWNYGTKKPGDRLLADTDKDLIIHTYGGTRAVKYTIYNVAITKIPDLALTAVRTLAGEVVFTGIGKKDVDPDTADSFVKVEAIAVDPTDAFDPDQVITESYAAAWGSTAPWDAMETTAGWTISFDLSLQPVIHDATGIIDWTIGDVRASARAQVFGITEAQVFTATNKLIDMHVKRGSKMPDDNHLIITGDSLKATLFSAQVRMIPTQFGTGTLRFADLEFTATRKVVTGALQQLFKIETN